MKIEIKNRLNGNVLFSHECEENSIIVTLKKAIKDSANLLSANLCGADLRSANLRSANLCGADLRSADLSSADLCGANLCGANLCGADLRSADLRSADLSSANLLSANLCGADLRSADLRSADLRSANLCGADLCGAKMPIYCKWSVSIIDNSKVKIGCQEKTISDWVEWFENSHEVFETDRNSDDFKRIRASFYAHKTYIENL